MQRILLSVEIEDKQVRIARLHFSFFGNKLTQVEFDCITFPFVILEQGTLKDPALFTAILKEYKNKHFRARHVKVDIALPFQNSFLRQYKIPYIPEKDRHSAIKYLVEEDVPALGTELVFDYKVTREDKILNTLEIQVAGAKRILISQLANAFQNAGYKVNNISFSFLVLQKVLNLNEYKDTVYIQTSFNSWQINLFKGLVPTINKSIYQLDSFNPTVLSQEIERLLSLYNGNSSSNKKITLWHDDGVPAQIVENLMAKGIAEDIKEITLNEISLELLKIVEPPCCNNFIDIFEGKWQKGLVLLGSMGKEDSSNCINLYHEQIKHRNSIRTRLLAVFLSLAILSASAWTYKNLKVSQMNLEKELSKLQNHNQLILEANKVEDEIRSKWNSLFEKPTNVGILINELLSVNATSGLKLESINYRAGQLSLKGNASNPSEVEQLLKSLRSLGWNPKLTTYKQEENQVSFSLSSSTETRN